MSSFIGSLFGRSPIRPMQQHMRAAVACARQVLPLFEERRIEIRQEYVAIITTEPVSRRYTYKQVLGEPVKRIVLIEKAEYA